MNDAARAWLRREHVAPLIFSDVRARVAAAAGLVGDVIGVGRGPPPPAAP